MNTSSLAAAVNIPCCFGISLPAQTDGCSLLVVAQDQPALSSLHPFIDTLALLIASTGDTAQSPAAPSRRLHNLHSTHSCRGNQTPFLGQKHEHKHVQLVPISPAEARASGA